MARARSVLERDPDRVTRCPPCHLIEGGHDPCQARGDAGPQMRPGVNDDAGEIQPLRALERSEEHTSELQSLAYLVCRLLLEKKKKTTNNTIAGRKTDCDYRHED